MPNMSSSLRRLISTPCQAGPSRRFRPSPSLSIHRPSGNCRSLSSAPATPIGRLVVHSPRGTSASRSATAFRGVFRRSQSTSTTPSSTSSTSSSTTNTTGQGANGATNGGNSGGQQQQQQFTNEEIRRAWEAKRRAHLEQRSHRNQSLLLYSLGAICIMGGVTYAAIPLYRAFCSATGFAGTPITDPARFSPERLYTTPETETRKRITVHFQATSSDLLPWKFEPQQRTVKVLPGETALAFYRAKNTSDQDIIGIATYNMTPDRVAPFFAKVECFCFEEQKIRAGEEVDLPVFFFIDRDIMDEPSLENLDDIVLSYTFFKARRNDRGHAIPDASEEVVLKSQGFDKYEHAPVPAPAPA